MTADRQNRTSAKTGGILSLRMRRRAGLFTAASPTGTDIPGIYILAGIVPLLLCYTFHLAARHP